MKSRIFYLNIKNFISCLVIMLGVQVSFCHAAVTPEAESTQLGRPTYPLPFYNSLGTGCCFFNAVLQCLLQNPKVCEFIDKIEKPKNDIELQLKQLRKNLKLFSCDTEVLKQYLSNSAIAWNNQDAAKIRKQIIACSKKPCLTMFNSSECLFGKRNSNTLTATYSLLKTIFGAELKTFFYSSENSIIFEVLNLAPAPEFGDADFEYELGNRYLSINPFEEKACSFFIFYAPSMSLAIVAPTDINKIDLESCNRLISAFEKFLSKNISKKSCELVGIDFMVSRTVVPTCYSEEGKILQLTEVDSSCLVDTDLSSSCLAHSAAYVKYDGKWIFCDDFFREKLYQPMIREFSSGMEGMFDDLINREDGQIGMLFFRAS